jgi:hypothetical protein
MIIPENVDVYGNQFLSSMDFMPDDHYISQDGTATLKHIHY